MNILKRAITSIKRARGKTVILGLLVVILASFTAGAILVRGAVTTTETVIRRRIPPFLSIAFDPEWASQHWMETGFGAYELEEHWPHELIPLLKNLPYVDDFVYTNQILGHLDLYLYDPIDNAPPFKREGRSLFGISGVEPILMQYGDMTLLQGRAFTEEESSGGNLTDLIPTMISRNTAQINDLTVGSIIPFYDRIHTIRLNLTEEEEVALSNLIFDLEIVGIFDIDYETFPERLTDPLFFEEYHLLSDALNAIYVPTWFIHELTHHSYETLLTVLGEERTTAVRQMGSPGDTSFPIIVLRDPLDLDAFRVAAEPLLSENLVFRDLSMMHYDALISMEQLLWIGDIVLISAIVATILILNLLIILFLRDRRYEMGVYMALGEKKSSIILQIVIEVLAISIIGITVALFVGNVVSSRLSQQMMQNELMQEIEIDEIFRRREEMGSIAWMIGMPQPVATAEETLALFDLTLTMETTIIFYTIGLTTIILSTVIPIIYVVKLEPKKILTDANA